MRLSLVVGFLILAQIAAAYRETVAIKPKGLHESPTSLSGRVAGMDTTASIAIVPTPESTTATVTDLGVISGRVTWDGAIPTTNTVELNVDGILCAQSDEFEISRIAINPDDLGVQNAVVYLEDIKSGKPLSELDRSWESPMVLRSCRFLTHVLLAPRRSVIRYLSSDQVLHDIRLKLDDEEFTVVLPTSNWEEKIRLRRPGFYEVSCHRHGWEHAWVIVVDHPYYMRTDENGNFALTDVPLGSYTLKVWHPGLITEMVMEGGLPSGYRHSVPLEYTSRVTVRKSNRPINIDLSSVMRP